MKSKLIIYAALGMSVFTAGTWALAFLAFLSGRYIHEPNTVIAAIEFTFAVALTILAVVAFILYLKRGYLR